MTPAVPAALATVVALAGFAVPAQAAAQPRGRLVVCNHAGYMFKVFADGPSTRHDHLAGEGDECTHWKPVLPGRYTVGFVVRSPSRKPIVISARVKRGDKIFYKVVRAFGGGIGLTIPPDELTRIDLFIRRA